jgi:hypothetical protein
MRFFIQAFYLLHFPSVAFWLQFVLICLGFIVLIVGKLVT